MKQTHADVPPVKISYFCAIDLQDLLYTGNLIYGFMERRLLTPSSHLKDHPIFRVFVPHTNKPQQHVQNLEKATLLCIAIN